MSYLSGQPLYCYELAMELKRQGHEIEVRSNWTAFGGTDGHKLFENIAKAGIRPTGWDSTWLTKDFDLWIASEEESMRIAGDIPDVPMIQIVHSEYDVETPIKDRPFAYVCIRPSIQDHIVKEHGIPEEKCHVIYNGIDRKRFKKGKKHKGDYNLTVVPCTFDPLREKFIRHCERLASKMNHFHFYGNPHGVEIKETEFVKVFPDTFNIEKPIAEADYVAGILLGRVNLEANSCGVPSKIYDPVTLKNTIFQMEEKEFDNKHNIKNVAKKILAIKRPTKKTKVDKAMGKTKAMPINKIEEDATLEDITIVIPHHDQHQRLADILNDLEGHIKNIVVVKGGTFAQNCNNGFKLCNTRYVVFLNDDTRIKDPETLFTNMLEKAKEYDIVGCRVEGTDAVNGFRIEDNEMVPVLNAEDPVDMPSGHCLLIKADAFTILDGYNEEFKNGCEDGDLYQRAMELEMKIGTVDDTMIHLQCQSTGRFDHVDENVILYNKKWGKIAKDLHHEREGREEPKGNQKGWVNL